MAHGEPGAQVGQQLRLPRKYLTQPVRAGSNTDKDEVATDLDGFVVEDAEQDDDFRGLGGWDDSEVTATRNNWHVIQLSPTASTALPSLWYLV
eukprot:8979435-Pyramimonas_sp.AAC.1